MEDTRVEALRRRVEEERSSSGKGRPRFSERLKRDVVALLHESKWGYARTSKALGLSEASLQRWPKHERPSKKKKRGRPSMKHVRIVADKPLYPTSKALRLELAHGAVVSGLTIDDVAELIRRFS